LHAYAFGMIDRWLRVASIAPRAANLFTHAPGVGQVLRKALHVASGRQLPRLAGVSFRQWAAKHHVPGFTRTNGAGREVMLWIDTFNNYFHPETSRAALGVLEDAGF